MIGKFFHKCPKNHWVYGWKNVMNLKNKFALKRRRLFHLPFCRKRVWGVYKNGPAHSIGRIVPLDQLCGGVEQLFQLFETVV